MKYRFFSDEQNITEIGSVDICTGAKFKLDKPMSVGIDDVFHLIDGQWYLETNGLLHLLEGRWARVEVQAYKVKKVNINERAKNTS